MATEKPTFSFKDNLAMFQKFTAGSAPPAPQKKQTVVSSVKPVQAPLPQKNTNTNKGVGEVESTSILKPNAIKEALQSKIVNNPQGSPNKLSSSFANNPWIQQNSTAKFTQKTVPPPAVKEAKPDNSLNLTLKQTFSETKQEESKEMDFEKIVKITQNALVDKESLPSQTAMKQLIEGRMSGIIGVKKLQQPPKRITTSEQLDSGPREAPVVQTDLKLGSVKENANRLNNFYQNKQLQKKQSQELQAKKREQQAEELALREKQHEIQRQNQHQKVQTSEHLAQENNSQNINVGFFSQVPQQPIQAETNVLNVASSNSAVGQPAATEGTEQGAETKEEQNNLANRLKKRKKTTKAMFDSDED